MRGAPGRRLAALVTVPVLLLQSGSEPGAGTRGPDPGYGTSCLAVGAWVPDAEAPGGLDDLGPVTIRRSFDRTVPASFEASAAGPDAAAGLHSFVSWKPPGGDHRGAAAGAYDGRITAWARSVPATGVFATAFHEPENDMTAAEFVSFQRHVYRVVKRANPTIRWGPVYMAYWWDPAQPEHYVGDPLAWWPGDGYADFVGLDWYGAEPEPMTGSPSFRHWFDVMAPTGLPLVIPEYGQAVVRAGEAPTRGRTGARAEAIRVDAAWIAEHPQVTAWLYWHGPGPRGDWRLSDGPSRRAWRDAAGLGCRPPAA